MEKLVVKTAQQITHFMNSAASFNHKLNPAKVPNFICIGGQRCGSSWLHYNLAEHPKINMSAKKELDFFSKTIKPEGVVKYYSYFEDAQGLRGESSPTYSAMFLDEIALLKQLIPELKIIFIVRNPGERLVSQITRKWSYDKISKRQGIFSLMREVDLSLPRRLTDYKTAYQHWTRFYGEDNVLLVKYDSLKSDPELFLQEVLAFLSLERGFIFPEETFQRRKNRTRTQLIQEMPDILRWYIACEWIEKVREIDKSMSIDVKDWIESLEREIALQKWYYSLIKILHKICFCVPYNLIYGIFNPLRIKLRVMRSRKNILKALTLS